MAVSPEGIRVVVIDVGKGDCILVQVGASAALIDAGYDDTAGKVVSYLRERGVATLEFLLITHYDKDHIGGIGAIGQAFPIGAVYLPGYVGADKQYRSATAAVGKLGVASRPVTQEVGLRLGDAVFTIVPSHLTYDPHAAGNEGNDNDLSLVATLAWRHDSYLFAGDLEEEGIDAYLEDARGHFGVLKVPHHGEIAGNLGDLLASAQPKVAIVTDSADEPADKKTLKQLRNAGADVYCTSECGTVAVTSDGTGSYRVSRG